MIIDYVKEGLWSSCINKYISSIGIKVLKETGINTRVPFGEEIRKLYIRYFVHYKKKHVDESKINVFIKVGADDEIGEKDADVSSDHFR